MSINIKKYTKDQMAKMVEDAAERLKSQKKENEELAEQLKSQTAKTIALRNDLMTKMHSNAVLTEKLDQMNGEAINKANEIANLKADADVLRNKLADTEAALGRANDECTFKQEVLNVMRNKRHNAEQRANYAESHPWRNLWVWLKRKLKMAKREAGRKPCLSFCREGEPLSFLLYFFSFGRGCYTQDVSMLCVCNYTEESVEREEKVSAPVVRNKRCRVTVGNRKLGSPSGDKNAAR